VTAWLANDPDTRKHATLTVSPAAASKPDLRVAYMFPADESGLEIFHAVTTSMSWQVCVDVMNGGAATAPASRLTLARHAVAADTNADTALDVPALAPGASTPVCWDVGPATCRYVRLRRASRCSGKHRRVERSEQQRLHGDRGGALSTCREYRAIQRVLGE
jgi:hypothetical protein